MEQLSAVESMKKNVDLILDNPDITPEKKKEYLHNLMQGFYEIITLKSVLSILRKAQTSDDEEYQTMLAVMAEEIKRESLLVPIFENELIERLSEIEHEQWASWAKVVVDEVAPERRERWARCFTQYKNLPDSLKAMDRIWATKVLESVTSYFLKFKNDYALKMMDNLRFCLEVHNQGQFNPDDFAVYKNSVIREFSDTITSEGLGEGRTTM